MSSSGMSQIEGTTFYCEHCHRPSGPAMVQCEYRAVNQCPYILRHGPTRAVAYVLMGLFFFACFFLVPLLAFLNTADPSLLITIFVIPFLIIGLSALGVAIYNGLGREIALSNPMNGLAWRKLSIIGLPLEHTVALGVQPLTLDFSTTPLLPDVPASVQALKAEHGVFSPSGTAQAVLRAALFDLLRRKILIAGTPTLYHGYLGTPLRQIHHPDYVLMFNPAHPEIPDGALEQRILASMKRWQMAGKAAKRGGMTIVDICRALYDGESYTSAYTWLLDIAEDDAIARGAGLMQHHAVQLGPLKSSYERYQPIPTLTTQAHHVQAGVHDFCQANGSFGLYFSHQVAQGLVLMDPTD